MVTSDGLKNGQLGRAAYVSRQFLITNPALTPRRGRTPLKAAADGPGERIAAAPGTTRGTVVRVRRRFAADGSDATAHRNRPTGRIGRWTASRRRCPSPGPARRPRAGGRDGR
jgi:hypothetical protein